MVRTYIYGVNIPFKKTIEDAKAFDKVEEVSWVPIDESSDFRDVSEEKAALRAIVSDYDLFGCGWRDTVTGEVWLFGCMTEKKMKEMDEELKILKEGTVL